MGRIFESPVALILILLVILLFGAKRLPDLARGVGRSLRIFKAETDGLRTDGTPEPTDATVLQATQEPAAPPSQQAPQAPQAAIAPPAPAQPAPAPAPQAQPVQPTVTYSVGPQVSQSAPAPSTPPQGGSQA